MFMNSQPDAKTIFLTAADIPSKSDRNAYLNEVCGDDAALRQRVDALLAAHNDPASFLERPVVEADPNVVEPTVVPQTVPESAGTALGPYKLLQKLGEGGMGTVFMTEQTEPVRRKVALKIIKPGMDSQQVIARFEAERQALAMMEHQNIARVLDAGTTDSALPYFVMELVKGVPITDYCDQNRLTPRERLKLFIPVCQAIQHAHQKGIIHRDIKPSNVLVTLYDGQPVPKVIDFGVAKATEQRLTERTMFTQYGQIVGTLEYMSPEQAEMNQLDVDTRSDVYSLGVLLYELLTGSTPITKEEFRDAGFVEMLRLIRETDPEKPSVRLSHSHDTLPTISAQRKSEPKKLGAVLQGELDWIVMKALEKDRTRRYESASDFAKDVRRHLDDEQVEACPPSTLYRLKKYCRKHKTFIATSAIILSMLNITIVVFRNQATRATRAEARAVTEALRATDAERDARNQLQEAERQATRAETAETSAMSERDRAVAAERTTQEQRDRAIEAERLALNETVQNVLLREHSQDTLAHSLLDQARAVRLADLPGHRWRTLELLQQAEHLRGRPRAKVVLSDEEAAKQPPPVALPTLAQLRSEAIALLLSPDGRVAMHDVKIDTNEQPPVPMQWDGNINAVSTDGCFVATASVNVKKMQTGLSVIEVTTGKEIWSPDQKNVGNDFPLVMAVSSGGKQLAWFSITSPGTLKLRDLATDGDPRTLAIPRPSPVDSAGETETPAVPEVTLPPVEKPSDDKPKTNPTPAEKLSTSREIMRRAVEAGAEAYAKQKKSADDTTARRVGQSAGKQFNIMPGALLFSPNGQWLSGIRMTNRKTEVLLWDLRNGSNGAGRVIATVDLRPHIRPSFSPDSRQLAWPDKQGTITLWNLAEDRQKAQFELPVYLDGMLAFTPDGKRFVVPGHHPDDAKGRTPQHPARIIVWDIAADEAVSDYETDPEFVATAIAVSVDGHQVVAGQMSGEMLVIDLAGGEKIDLDHGSMTTSLNWTPNGRIVSTGIGACKVWELSTATPITTYSLSTERRNRPILQFALSPDNRSAVIEYPRAPSVDLYDLHTGKRTGRFETGRRFGIPGARLLFNPDGSQIVRAGFDGVRIWDIDGDGQPQSVDEKTVFKGSMVTGLGFREDGTLLLAGFDEFHPAVKEGLTGNLIWKRNDQQRRAWPRISHDGSLVAFHTEKELGRSDRMIEVCRLPAGDVVHRIPSARKGFNFQTVVDISPDNRWLIEIELAFNAEASWAGNNPLNSPSPVSAVSGGTDESWQGTLWNMETGKPHWEIVGEVKSQSMAFSPNGRYFAVAQRDGLLVLWDVERRMRLFDWQAWDGVPGIVKSARSVTFTADSARLAVLADSMPAVRLLDLKQLNQQLNDIGLGWK